MQRIILFDGDCNLCGKAIRLIQKHSHTGRFVFYPIQSEKGQQLINKFFRNNEKRDSVIYLENGITYLKSDAFFKIVHQIGGIYKLFLVFKVLPKKLTDQIYDFIARNRYKWFGKNDVCRIESQD